MFRSDSANFVVLAPDPAFARKVNGEAERFRRELAVDWLGQELPAWREKCPIHVSLSPHSGGETSFAFVSNGIQRAEPNGWDMKVFGTPERILDSVLPHEITHTIFATHFRQPLPRWADEGACTTVEHNAEKQKNHQMLIGFLSASPSRGIPFNRMFTLRDYPEDILPLYAQGFSVAKFLITQKGRKPFMQFLATGMELETPGQETRAWDQATQQHYGYKDLSELQVRWQRWVADGSNLQELQRQDSAPSSGLATGLASRDAELSQQNRQNTSSASRPTRTADNREQNLQQLNQGWYAKQMKAGGTTRSFSPPKNPAKTIWR